MASEKTEQEKKKAPLSIFRSVPKWQDLRFYQKSEVLYQMTFVFCERFLPKHGDRKRLVQVSRTSWRGQRMARPPRLWRSAY